MERAAMPSAYKMCCSGLQGVIDDSLAWDRQTSAAASEALAEKLHPLMDRSALSAQLLMQMKRCNDVCLTCPELGHTLYRIPGLLVSGAKSMLSRPYAHHNMLR